LRTDYPYSIFLFPRRKYWSYSIVNKLLIICLILYNFIFIEILVYY